MSKPKKTTLTERFCEGVKVAGKREDFRDDKVPGLYFRVTPRGAKSWSLLYTDRRTGKKRRLDLGRYIDGQEDKKVEERDGVTLARARQLAREHVADVGNGADPAKGVSMRRDGLTFKELAELRLTAMRPMKADRKRRSIDNYRSMLSRHVYPAIGELKAIDIKKADIKSMLAKVVVADDARFLKANDTSATRRRAKRSAAAVHGGLMPGRKVSHQPNRVFELVRSIFRWGVGEDLIEQDAMSGMKPPVEDDGGGRTRSLSEKEVPDFWRALDAAPITRQLALAMKVEVLTGQRTGELIGRLKTEVDWSGKVPVLLIPRTATKNKQPHRVPLSPLAVALIKEASDLDPESIYIFPSSVRDAALTPAAATKAMGRLREKGAVTDLRVHDLRRTAANGMRRLGVPKFIVSVVLNHISVTKSDVTTEHYLDEFAFEPEKTDALLKWGAKLEEILAAAGILPPRPQIRHAVDTELSTGAPTGQTMADVPGPSTAVGTGSAAVSLATPPITSQSFAATGDLSNQAGRGGHVANNHGLGLRRVRHRRWRTPLATDAPAASGDAAEQGKVDNAIKVDDAA